MCDSVLQEVVRLVMPVVRRTATSWVLADVVATALGAMLPNNRRRARLQRWRCEIKRCPLKSRNARNRTSRRALETWHGSAESSLRRPSALAELLFHLAAPVIPQRIQAPSAAPQPKNTATLPRRKRGSNAAAAGSP